MISVVLYGRNDSYGYNLHKRAALSFNCIAEVLEDEADEILFVDYNTPNDFPTFPEAIQDTLTDKAKRRLRILRVRPHVHDRFRTKTRLIALEPISRNIAVRRSNPANRWVLSTNTDMIFVPRSGLSLTALARDLPPGFYHAPRIEIPETLWEGLDRTKSIEVIETVREWGGTLHLNEIVKGSPAILYDGPGDFQLMERDVLFNMQGFHEEMILGWHVDSNIAKRLLLHYLSIGDLGNDVYGYHCDHTRQITPAHSSNRTENDWRRFVDDVTRSDIPEQRDTWGCPKEEIEEIRLGRDNSTVYVSALRAAIGEPLSEPYQALYTGTEYGKTAYDPRHVLPFLADLFVCSPKSTSIGWIGRPNETLRMFAEVWSKLGFTGRILVDNSLAQWVETTVSSVINPADTATILAQADAFVFDFPTPDSRNDAADADGDVRQTIRLLRGYLPKIVRAEHKRFRGGVPLRQVIGINAINNDHEGFVVGFVAAGLTPFATRMRHGYVIPPVEGPQDWTNSLQAGDAGLKDSPGVRTRGDMVGMVARGLHKPLTEGRYRLVFSLSGGARPSTANREDVVATITFLSWRMFVAWKAMTWNDLERGSVEVEINAADDVSAQDMLRLEALVYNWVPVDLRIDKVTCELVGPPQDTAAAECRALTLDNWLRLLAIGPNGRRKGTAVVSDRTDRGFGNVVFGPYWYLPAGDYCAVFEIDCNSLLGRTPIGKVDAFQSLKVSLGESYFSVTDLKAGAILLPFTVGDMFPDSDSDFVEIRVWSMGTKTFTVRSVEVRPGKASDIDFMKRARGPLKTRRGMIAKLVSRVKARLKRQLQRGF